MTLVNQITPPIVMSIARKVKAVISPPKGGLFEGDDQAFLEAAPKAKTYGEYGCGASTRWMAANTDATIYAVDTAQPWIDSVRSEVGHRDSLSLHWVDVGVLTKWGRPVGFTKSDSFQEYTDWIWRQDQKPDLVLVDGRFRVGCFATSLKHAAEATTIIFDDYSNRQQYHIVEQLIQRDSMCGRQAIFKVPAKTALDMEAINRMIAHFRFVMD